jgi:aryl-alcohol dehydrogenase-like predicted oxidoreductase
MRYRLLGQTGLRVSELFLGAMRFGEGGGGASPDECRRMLDLYADAGGNVVDTAINYRGGQSESILGELLEGHRDRLRRCDEVHHLARRRRPERRGAQTPEPAW